jgi:hypothetical protein
VARHARPEAVQYNGVGRISLAVGHPALRITSERKPRAFLR